MPTHGLAAAVAAVTHRNRAAKGGCSGGNGRPAGGSGATGNVGQVSRPAAVTSQVAQPPFLAAEMKIAPGQGMARVQASPVAACRHPRLPLFALAATAGSFCRIWRAQIVIFVIPMITEPPSPPQSAESNQSPSLTLGAMLKPKQLGTVGSVPRPQVDLSGRNRQEERPPAHHPSLSAVSALCLPLWATEDNLCRLCCTRCGGLRPETALPADQVKVLVLPGGRNGAPEPSLALFHLFYVVLYVKTAKTAKSNAEIAPN